jgi:hypothetical protein
VKNANTRAQVVRHLVLAHINKGVEKHVESAGLEETGRVRHRDRTCSVFNLTVSFRRDRTRPELQPDASSI